MPAPIKPNMGPAHEGRSQAAARRRLEKLAGALGDAVQRFGDEFDAAERDMVGRIIHRLDVIAEGELK